jgi:hypothetical protein
VFLLSSHPQTKQSPAIATIKRRKESSMIEKNGAPLPVFLNMAFPNLIAVLTRCPTSP